MLKWIRWAALAAALATPVNTVAATPDFSGERFRAHVAFLADDLLEGREPGQRGHEIAARYVAAQFALLGLKPGGEKGGWFQQVSLIETTPTDAPANFTVSGPAGTKAFDNGGEAVIRGIARGGAVDAKGKVVFVGYGASDPAAKIDDYKGLDVRGKIVVLFRGVGPGVDSEIGAHHRSELIDTAARKGALGVIIIRTRAGSKTAWRSSAANAARPVTNWIDAAGAMDDPNIPIANVSETVAELLFAGAPRSLEQVKDEVDKGVRPGAMELATTAEIKVTTKTRRYSSPEVIGLIEGSDPKLRTEYIVLMAHLDHLGIRAAEGRTDSINNGALDNAAGSATLLEVARAVKAAPLKRSVLIIANTGEEKGLLGAGYFAHHPTVPVGPIVAGVDLDMPILTYDFTDVVAYGGAHSTLDRSIAKAAQSMKLKLAPDWQPTEAIFVRSDHYELVRAGIPAVMLTTGIANGGKAAWQEFNDKHYHQPSDDLSQPIIWAQGAKFAELNYRVVRELANGRERPMWYAGDYFGDLFAPKAEKATRAKR